MAQSNAKSEVTLEIDSLSQGPHGIGRREGRVVMVPGTVPGDRISAQIVASKSSYEIGRLTALIKASPQRREPRCPYVGVCGGCQWQQVNYIAQLAAKMRNLDDALRRIGKLRDFEIRPVASAPREFGYRRRIQLRCDANKELGFSPSASHDLAAIDACAVAAEPVNRVLRDLRRWIKGVSTNIAEVEIVAGDQAHESAVLLSTSDRFVASDSAKIEELVSGERVTGIILKSPGGRQIWGNPRISVITEPGIELLVDADVFTQVSPEGNRALVHHLLAAGQWALEDRVLELYCGAGNFTLSIARRSGEVVAVEGNRRAVESGKLNAHRHGIENIRWRAESVLAAVAALARRKECFSKILLDPPRAGAKGIDAELAAFGADQILYVSCNPPTLARDLSALSGRGYKLTGIQPIDLFPQTFHLETLALLERH
ncbi:MAG TPA: 23S rRNA (uracil(1939)-C(5))-methyltransferase RlmD [Candidatus Binatia bacterium]|nr:23S rRNA (uracil(1939)-C(5))-methyltransferase RlmD [Candidatus Binatia bacterium]